MGEANGCCPCHVHDELCWLRNYYYERYSAPSHHNYGCRSCHDDVPTVNSAALVQTMAAPQYMQQAPVQTMAALQYMQQAPVQTMAAPQYMQQAPVQTIAAPQFIGEARTLAPTSVVRGASFGTNMIRG